ncbi:MAG: cobyric acid synthase [Polaromonas sp.]|uniref:cobyric acid synthase n=1 Tax=Polaromonas sp. TaxID=1869339 RepID=UPI0017C7D2DC|nr:cobyric acid synthase [Polaromonas sp.]MBA3593626.1 cobyric acid synthase [Polaromonas sp.]
MRAKAIMVLGTTSGAGKSWLTTALCRYYANQGLKVAPFKAQNMSNNARVVAPTLVASRTTLPPEGANFPWGGPAENCVPGGEIGSAQYFQALAARAVPEVRMNPLLLKPEKDTQSQVILMGQVNTELSRMAWRGRSASVWPVIAQALDELMAENDVVVIEGAGSPAEINLKDSDIVNMRVALHAHAACLLVTDIDRGGAFAHLYGTWAMLDNAEQKLIKGFVLNKFRGDATLLAPGPQMLQNLTSVPTVATLPMWWQHGLPEEDGVFDASSRATGTVTKTIAVIAYPRISNLDEFQPLKNVPGIRLQWVRSPSELAGLSPADWVILPGSKHTSGDLDWLRAQGLDRAVAEHAGRGGAVLGICGGLQMLGEALIDTHGIDGNGPGLGLLPVVTMFEPAKTVRHREAGFTAVSGPWSALSGVMVRGYEIHHGQTAPHSAMAAAGDLAQAVLPEGLGWQNAAGNVLGVYLHGLFEDPAVLQALFGAGTPTLDSVFEGLAGYIDRHFEPSVLNELIAGRVAP